MRAHGDVIAVRDGVEARVLDGAEGVDDAIALLDAAESVVEVPLVDETERARLHQLAEGGVARAAHWHSLLARRDGEAVGYAGVVLDEADVSTAVSDVAVARDQPPCGPTLSALLAGIEALGWRHEAARVQAWVRHATAPDVSCATEAGYGVDRRLAVLGRTLGTDLDRSTVPRGMQLRPFEGDADADAVVSVLAQAYEATADDGWTREQFDERRSYDWFRAEDLLLLEDADGQLLGLHWTKRRGDQVGEVYNLAVAPEGQGRGWGEVLLRAGLRHLREVGCDEVLLWVDLSNERAVRLYTSNGFVIRWEDVALTRALRGHSSVLDDE